MPDITMCPGATCAYKDQCYRHTAQPKPHWQSWFMNPPRADDGTCEYFWPDDNASAAGRLPTFYVQLLEETKNAVRSTS